jgi:hypothetical protein
VVIVRYPSSYCQAPSTNATVITAGSYINYIFTTSGTISF